jgi:hypothetical protein
MAVFVVVLSGCESENFAITILPEENAADSSDPRTALLTMLELAETGDWESYVDQFYGEKHKFTDPSDQEKVVQRFRDGWGATVVEQLNTLRDVNPEIIDDGKRASFAMPDGNVFYLYKSDTGKWTFHL